MTRVEAFEREEDKNPRPVALQWKAFVSDTTLHGIRYVFLERPRWIRALWLLLLLAATGYYLSIVYNAVCKFLNRPINTIVSNDYVKELAFPAVRVCPMNQLSRRRVSLRDTDPAFVKEGLNMKECDATAAVRAGKPCGEALLCCCLSFGIIKPEVMFPDACRDDYRKKIRDALKSHNVSLNVREFNRRYGVQLSDILTPVPQCVFGAYDELCGAADFDVQTGDAGNCFTFNSGTGRPLKKTKHHGLSAGLNLMLDAQTYDYTFGQFSEGFRVVVHHQGEYVAPWDGISVGIGTHVAITTAQQEVWHLPAPYRTNCTRRNLKHLAHYTRDGCFHECVARAKLHACNCQTVGYDAGDNNTRFCFPEDQACLRNRDETIDYEACDCQLPCSRVTYMTTASYSKFPDTVSRMFLHFLNITDEYSKRNLVFVQVALTSMVNQVWDQEPAYDSGALFGEIGGNMGLFLGCSIITICEFVDFIISICIARRR